MTDHWNREKWAQEIEIKEYSDMTIRPLFPGEPRPQRPMWWPRWLRKISYRYPDAKVWEWLGWKKAESQSVAP